MNPNAKDNLTPFKSGQSGNPKGRPKKMISKLSEITGQDYGIQLTKNDLHQIIQWVIEKTESEIVLIKDNIESPFFIKTICMALLEDHKNGRISTIKEIFDRVLGKPTQENVFSGDSNKPIYFKVIENR